MTGRVAWDAEAAKFLLRHSLESSDEVRNKDCGWPHLARTAAATEAMARSSSPSSLPPSRCGERLAWLPPARCSSILSFCCSRASHLNSFVIFYELESIKAYSLAF